MAKKTETRAIRGSKIPAKAFMSHLDPERLDVADAAFATVREEFLAWRAKHESGRKRPGRPPSAAKARVSKVQPVRSSRRTAGLKKSGIEQTLAAD